MKKVKGVVALMLLSFAAFMGCASVKVEKNDKDGTACTAHYASFLKTMDGVSMSACDAQGATEKSANDMKAVNALLGMILKGLEAP